VDLLWQSRGPYSAMGHKPSLKDISDDELLRRLTHLLKQSRRCEADLVAHIAEVDARRLYARQSTSSMFVYCTERLHLSEAEAWLRITAARASREHPMLLTMLRDGRIHLSGIRRLAPHLTPENRDRLLTRATHRSRREIEELVAELAPRPDAATRIRKLPERRAPVPPSTGPGLGPDPVQSTGPPPVFANSMPVASPVAPGERQLGPDPVGARPTPARKARMETLAPARYKVEFTADAELRDNLERLQALMRSSVPDGDLAKIIAVAVTEKLERLEAKRFARTKKPRKSLDGSDTTPKSRHIPAAVRRAVHERDCGRCTYRDRYGRRCAKRHDLEFHHDGTPFGKNGDHSLENIRLMCKTHNALRAEEEYGKEVMARFRRSARRVPGPLESSAVGSPSRQQWSAPG